MNRATVARVTGVLLFVLAVLLVVPAVFAAVEHDHRAALAYGSSALLTLAAGMILRFAGRRAPSTLHRKDAFGVVALIWACLGTFGALPLLLEGAIPSMTGAIFEAVSGFTTTGATVVADVDGLSRATNLWRCLMHWVGGMGIIVLFVAVFPQLGVGAKQLFRTEVPGPITEGLRPRIKQTAMTLWWVYAGLTAACGALLWRLGMSAFDAVCHAFSTLGTGGFSSHTASIGHFGSASIDWTVAAFMLVAGLNFGLYYAAVRGRWRELVRNAELQLYLALNVVVIFVLAVSILPRLGDPLSALRHGAFQTLAVTTTTGFMTEDFDSYPEAARAVLFVCMFIGACAGSTAGGLKVIRLLLLAKLAGRELRSAVQPQLVAPIRLGGQPIDDRIATSAAVYAATYLGIFVFATLVLVAVGMDLVSASSATVACLASVGPGLGSVGPSQNYAAVPAVGKLLLSSCMIAGRLEIFSLLAVFSPEAWRR